MNEHIYETFLDLGVIGEQKCEVFYFYHKGNSSWNCFSFEPPEYSGAEITAVVCEIDGKEINITNLLNDDLISDLEHECGEAYRG